MKKIFNWAKVVVVILLSIRVFMVVLGCQSDKPILKQPKMVAKSYYDSLRIKDSVLLANCKIESMKKDTIVNDVEVLLAAYKLEQSLNKKLKDSLFQQNWRIVKAKHYIRIVQKNPHDLVFLVGWLNNQCFN